MTQMLSGSASGRVCTRPSRNAKFISAAMDGFSFSPSDRRCRRPLPVWSSISLGWVAFATVNAIFKDRILAANDHRYQQMQAAYGNRVADLQISYDELNGALVAAEDKFKATADALQTKQNAISGFLSRENQAEAVAGPIHAAPTNTPLVFGGAPEDSVAGDGPDVAASAPDGDSDAGGSSALLMMPDVPAPQPRTGKDLPAQTAKFPRQGMAEPNGALRSRCRFLHDTQTSQYRDPSRLRQTPCFAFPSRTDRVRGSHWQ